MTENYYSNAMTEIALALAMAFFSVMVLTMLSMGSEFRMSEPRPEQGLDGLTLAPSRAAPDGGSPDETIIIHYRGRFLDARLEAVDPAALAPAGRVVLAMEPALPMAQAIAARDRVAARDLVVTTLDERWLQALRETQR